MARKAMIEKNKRRQEMVNRHFEKREKLKKAVKNMELSFEEREEARIKLNKMKRDTSPIRVRNRCELTGRSRGFLRKFKLSRLCFREMSLSGLIPGISKSSW